MTSEWLKVMLEEIARKRVEAEEARLEAHRRDAQAAVGAAADGAPCGAGAQDDPAAG